MKRRCEDPLISQTLGFDTYRMGNCIKTDNESKYKIEELTKGNFFRTFNVVKISFWSRKKSILLFLKIFDGNSNATLEKYDQMMAFNSYNNDCIWVVK